MPKRVRFKLNNLLLNSSKNLFVLQILIQFFVNVWAIDSNVTEATNRYTVDTNGNRHANSRSPPFKCPEQFGYYPDNNDCSKYYVCVFGDHLHETCTGGLYFSSELQTCDWPRNVECANDMLTGHQKYGDDHITDAFNENMDQTIDEDVDNVYDNHNKHIEKTISNDENNRQNNGNNEDMNEEEVAKETTDEEEDESEGESDDKTNDYMFSNNNNKSNNESKIDITFDNNYSNNFDESDSESNDTDIYADALDIQRSKVKIINSNDNRVVGIIGRSANGFGGYESDGGGRVRDRDLHKNKVNIEDDPQQPSYDEAISSVVDEMGGIHIHDGPGGVYALPDKHHINHFQSTLNYNDKDLGFNERIAADRRPIVRVRTVRKHMSSEGTEGEERIEKQLNYNSDKNMKNKYIPVLVMDKEDIHSDNEEKVRRYRSDDNTKEDVLTTETVSTHFQNQKRQQQQHFRDQNQSKMSLAAAIPIAVSKKERNKSLELRGFVTTRDKEGKVIAIPIFKDMINADSSAANRRKRVRVVHRMGAKPVEDIPVMAFGHKSMQNHLPRILVPEQSQWQPYLPFYGPSLTQIKKVQILPPSGPIPVHSGPELDLMTVFRPKQQRNRSKNKIKISDYFMANNENRYEAINPREAEPRTETTTRPGMRAQMKPKRIKTKHKITNNLSLNQSMARNMTTRLTASSMPETTTQSFIEFVTKNDKNGREGRGHEVMKIKLSRNGKRLQNNENKAMATTASPSSDPILTTTPKSLRNKERIIISNTGAEPLNGYDYYEFPYLDNGSNHTITYTTVDESSPTTATPVTAPVDKRRNKQTETIRKHNRPKKGSSAPASRPAPIYPTPALLATATKCTTSKCRLPDCMCGGTAAPNGLSAKDIPQMLMITFDDSVNDLNWEIYEEIFTNRHNPNGCPILGTFYVSHEWTDYGQVQTLYSRGHEMASHSITHSFGEKFSAQKWSKEIGGQREILHMYGGVSLADVRGMRAPFLQGGGNKQFEMLYETNFTYDSTMPVFENSPPFWPYTLDYAINHECMIAPCPTKSFPGVWEVGMVMWHDLKGGRCSMGDACSNPSDEEGVFKMLLKNFNRHYLSNRAPLGFYYHSAWFNTPHHRSGFMRFIDEMLTKNDVYFVTKYQMIEWMRAPTPLSAIQSFQAWNCEFDDRPAPCSSPVVCNVGSKSGSRFLKTCQPCPKQYPWVGNTGFDRSTTT